MSKCHKELELIFYDNAQFTWIQAILRFADISILRILHISSWPSRVFCMPFYGFVWFVLCFLWSLVGFSLHLFSAFSFSFFPRFYFGPFLYRSEGDIFHFNLELIKLIFFKHISDLWLVISEYAYDWRTSWQRIEANGTRSNRNCFGETSSEISISNEPQNPSELLIIAFRVLISD